MISCMLQVLQTVNDAYSPGPQGEEEEPGAEAAYYTPVTDYMDYTDCTELVPAERTYEEIIL